MTCPRSHIPNNQVKEPRLERSQIGSLFGNRKPSLGSITLKYPGNSQKYATIFTVCHLILILQNPQEVARRHSWVFVIIAFGGLGFVLFLYIRRLRHQEGKLP